MRLAFRLPRGDLNLSEQIPLSLYVHVPWCVSKCPYCDFNSHAQKAPIPEADYLKALLLDLEATLDQVWGRRLQTIFIGGGTPSLLSGHFYEQLLSGIRARIPVLPDAEITLEANPGTAEIKRFTDYREAGINRLSLGIQSFSDIHLKRLGRIHDRQSAFAAIAMAKSAGFTDINIDVMFGLPDQTLSDALEDLNTAIAQNTNHLSWYQLTLEPNTAFYHTPPRGLPSHDLQADIEELGQLALHKAGFQQYEVSAYTRTKPCLHNMGYWTFGDYIGIGAGAHGKLSRPDLGSIIRTLKPKHPKAYLSDSVTQAQTHPIAPSALPFEFMLNALRLVEGVPFTDFEARTGLLRSSIASPMQKGVAKGWLIDSHDRIQLTPRGRRFVDSVVSLFLENHD